MVSEVGFGAEGNINTIVMNHIHNTAMIATGLL
jgi:hypothetical protein